MTAIRRCLAAGVLAAGMGLAGTGPAAAAVDGQLAEQFLEPPGITWGSFVNGDGATIRTAHLRPEGKARATLLIATGLEEFTEKYFELLRALSSRGVEVWTMDWRGQGASQRYLPNPHKRGVIDFANDIRDFKQFRDTVAKPDPARPPLLMAQSMGGNIMLRYLHDHPGDFAAAFVTAPLIDFETGAIPRWAARGLAWVMTRVGNGDGYAAGGADWVNNPAYGVADSLTSTDPERYKVHVNWYVRKPELQIGGVTWRWLDKAFESIAVLNRPETLAGIATPLVLVSAGIDGLVKPQAHDRACVQMPACTLLKLNGSKHEPWMERDEIRDQVWKAFDDFLARHAAK